VRALEMRRGSLDLVVNDLPADSLAYFRAHGYQVLSRPGSSFAYVGLNCAREPLDRREVRLALAMALDREAVVRNLLRGFARPATGLLPPEHWAYEDPAARLARDPAKAAALLDGEGLRPGPEGVRFGLSYKTSENKVSRQIAVAFAQDLAGIGVRVKLQSLEWGTFYGDVQRGDFDCFALTWVGVTDPDGFRLRFGSAAVPPEGFNRGRYRNAEVDRLVREGALEFDPLRRRALYGRLQQILADDVPCIPLWWPDAVCVAKPGVTGIRLPPDGNFSFLTSVRPLP
jgi:peptide/nickel transport system substrate-binding protein